MKVKTHNTQTHLNIQRDFEIAITEYRFADALSIPQLLEYVPNASLLVHQAEAELYKKIENLIISGNFTAAQELVYGWNRQASKAFKQQIEQLQLQLNIARKITELLKKMTSKSMALAKVTLAELTPELQSSLKVDSEAVAAIKEYCNKKQFLEAQETAEKIHNTTLRDAILKYIPALQQRFVDQIKNLKDDKKLTAAGELPKPATLTNTLIRLANELENASFTDSATKATFIQLLKNKVAELLSQDPTQTYNLSKNIKIASIKNIIIPIGHAFATLDIISKALTATTLNLSDARMHLNSVRKNIITPEVQALDQTVKQQITNKLDRLQNIYGKSQRTQKHNGKPKIYENLYLVLALTNKKPKDDKKVAAASDGDNGFKHGTTAQQPTP